MKSETNCKAIQFVYFIRMDAKVDISVDAVCV